LIFERLQNLNEENPRVAFLGSFDRDAPLNKEGRVKKLEPPQTMSGHTTQKDFDFILNGFDFGSIGIECKNYREWLYPNSFLIKETIKLQGDFIIQRSPISCSTLV
jgi:hypothetical protein